MWINKYLKTLDLYVILFEVEYYSIKHVVNIANPANHAYSPSSIL